MVLDRDANAMVQEDAQTQIELFQPCDRGRTPLLGGENDKNHVFFKN